MKNTSTGHQTIKTHQKEMKNTSTTTPTEEELRSYVNGLETPAGIYLTPELKAYYQGEMDRCSALHFEDPWYMPTEARTLMDRVNRFSCLQTKYSRFTEFSADAAMGVGYLEVAYTEPAQHLVRERQEDLRSRLSLESAQNIETDCHFFDSSDSPQRLTLPYVCAKLQGEDMELMWDEHKHLLSIVDPLGYNSVASVMLFFGPDPDEIEPEYLGAIPMCQPNGGRPSSRGRRSTTSIRGGRKSYRSSSPSVGSLEKNKAKKKK
jgi:hypothetical protein